jgi:hypothetical protein
LERNPARFYLELLLLSSLCKLGADRLNARVPTAQVSSVCRDRHLFGGRLLFVHGSVAACRETKGVECILKVTQGTGYLTRLDISR